MSAIGSDAHFIELSGRGQRLAGIGALAISLLVVVSSATSWSHLALTVGVHLIVVPVNVLMTRHLTPRIGARGEIYRALLNQTISCVGYSLIGWPLAVWLWLPYVAAVFDQSGGRHAVLALALSCSMQGVAGLVYGVHWTIPLAFTLVAAFVWLTNGTRLAIIRDMLMRAEHQRDELAAAHRALQGEVAIRQRIELELRQAQKLEAIGRLAAGVAHEVNTPLQCVVANLELVADTVDQVFELHAACLEVARAPSHERDAALATLHRLHDEGDTDELARDVPEALAMATDACGRVAHIVRSMQRFTGRQEYAAVPLHECVETTLALARHEYALVADIERSFDASPVVQCNAGEISQVLLNLVVNAAHAVEEVVATTGRRGVIRVRIAQDEREAVVDVTDTGGGISEAARARLFEPFFTTKPVGRGTGQGLSISRTIVERHGGTLQYTSEPGQGTTFSVRLPMQAAAPVRQAA